MRSSLAVALSLCSRPPPPRRTRPSLTIDTVFSLPGVNELDFRPGLAVDDAHGAAIDPALGRMYAVGRTKTLGGDTDIAVVARRADGSLDPGFADDGRSRSPSTPVATTTAVSLAVLPDHRLRVLGATDVSLARPRRGTGRRAIGRHADPDFGVAGIARFSVGRTTRPPRSRSPDGRLAITGSTAGPRARARSSASAPPMAGPSASVRVGGLRRAGGGPPRRVRRLGAGRTGRAGRDRPPLGGTANVDSSTSATLGGPSSFGGDGQDSGSGVRAPRALLVRDGTLWATGSVVTNSDSDAWLARLGRRHRAGTRRFDIRGTAFASTQPVNTKALSLTLVPGDPDTLVVGGSTASDRGEDWSFAAFNGLDGPVSALRTASRVPSKAGAGPRASPRGRARQRRGHDHRLRPGPRRHRRPHDRMGRVLVDAEKRCDLALELVRPLELVMRGKAPRPLTYRITNTGERACDGTVRLPAPYTMVETWRNRSPGRGPVDHADGQHRLRRPARRRHAGGHARRARRRAEGRQHRPHAGDVLVLRPRAQGGHGAEGARHRRWAAASVRAAQHRHRALQRRDHVHGRPRPAARVFAT